MDNLLEQGIAAYKAGKRDEARNFFATLIKQSPDDERAWGWMYQVSNDDQERIYCLKQALRINPKNEKARQLLDQLLEPPFTSSTPPSSTLSATRTPSSTRISPPLKQNNSSILVLWGSALLLLIVMIGILSFMFSSKKESSKASVPIQSNPIVQPTEQENVQYPSQPCPPCTVLVNSWRFEIQEIHSDPGKDPSRQNIVLIGNIYNEGREEGPFMPRLISLTDSNGRKYESDIAASYAAQQKYGTEFLGGNPSPGAYAYAAYAYDVLSSETYFEIVAGKLVATWGGNFYFNVR